MLSITAPMLILWGALFASAYLYCRYLITPLVKQSLASRNRKNELELTRKGDAIAQNTAYYRILVSEILEVESNTFSKSQAFILEASIKRIASKGLMSYSQLNVWVKSNTRQAFKPIIFS